MTGKNILRILAVFIILVSLGFGIYCSIVKDQIIYFIIFMLIIGIILVFTAPIWDDE